MGNGHSAPVREMPPEIAVPHSVEAEEAVLGSILINPEQLLRVALVLDPDDFFIVRNAWVYEAMLHLAAQGVDIDYITLNMELQDQGHLEEIGGPAYLINLLNGAPPHLYAVSYAGVVYRASVRRLYLAAASEVAQVATADDTTIQEVIERAERAVLSVALQRGQHETASLAELSGEDFDRVEALRASGGALTGIPTGLCDLDNLMGGMQPEDVIIIAGRPGIGKTSLLLSIALNAAQAGHGSFILSLEMSRSQLVQRFKAALSEVSTQKMRTGNLNDAEFAAFVAATGKLSELNIWIDDANDTTPLQLMAKAQRHIQRHHVEFIIIDYVQLMNSGSRIDNRAQEVGAISRGIKQMARALNVPVLVAAQLNREVENRATKKPQLSDLRESGSLEQDADVVLFIHREEVYKDDSDKVNQADLIIAKHRNGPTGTVQTFFKKNITTFANLRKAGGL